MRRFPSFLFAVFIAVVATYQNKMLSAIPVMIFLPRGFASYGPYNGMSLSIPQGYLKIRQETELAADYFGIQYLFASGYDPESMLRFLERVWPLTRAGNKALPVNLSPYPAVPDRLQAMRAEIQRILPQRDAATISTSEFEEMQEYLRAVIALNQMRADAARPTLRRPGENFP